MFDLHICNTDYKKFIVTVTHVKGGPIKQTLDWVIPGVSS